MKHNNQIVQSHFKKDWQNRVRTWFNQPARKQRRRVNRIEKATRVAPRPVSGLLRPQVRASSLRYNSKIKPGRGFTLDELKQAGINVKEARNIGIAVDHRRHNASVETLQANVQRLKTYRSKLILMPRKNKHPKKGDATKEEAANAVQLTTPLMPVVNVFTKPKARAVTDEDRKSNVYNDLRWARSDQRLWGIRKKRADEASAAAAQRGK